MRPGKAPPRARLHRLQRDFQLARIARHEVDAVERGVADPDDVGHMGIEVERRIVPRHAVGDPAIDAAGVRVFDLGATLDVAQRILAAAEQKGAEQVRLVAGNIDVQRHRNVIFSDLAAFGVADQNRDVVAEPVVASIRLEIVENEPVALVGENPQTHQIVILEFHCAGIAEFAHHHVVGDADADLRQARDDFRDQAALPGALRRIGNVGSHP